MKITFPHMGNTYITAKALLDDLNAEYVIPPLNNKKAVEEGIKHAPEMACLPLKINLGNYIQAYEEGADTILITGGCGPCRFGYYCEIEREILKDIGYEMDVLILEMPDDGVKGLIKRVRKLNGGFNIHKLLKAVWNATDVSKKTDELERLTYRIRPREIKKGTTDKIYDEFRNKALYTKGSKNIKNLILETENKLNGIEIDKDFKPMKIGIVGEIYTTLDSYTSFNMDSKLGAMGFEVDRAVTLSWWIIDHIIKKALHLPVDNSYKKEAEPYLGAMIGGHAQETIGHAIQYAKKGYDGILQIFPLTCMPEIVAQSILPSIERDYGIPVLTLIIDEMTGEAGYVTRLEAFADLLKKRKGMTEIEKSRILFGN